VFNIQGFKLQYQFIGLNRINILDISSRKELNKRYFSIKEGGRNIPKTTKFYFEGQIELEENNYRILNLKSFDTHWIG